MIDQATIDRILDASRIEEVVGEFVTLRKRGVNYLGLCPFHDEKTPSFSVSPTRGICKCFSCGKGGNAVHFIMEHEQLSYYDALKWLAKKYNIEVVEKELSAEDQQARNDRESMFIINEFARDYYIRTLHEHIDGKSIGLGYFRERGFREDIIRKFQLGYSLDQRDAFTREALAKGYQKEFLLKTGLTLANDQGNLHDRYRARVMFPVHTLSGKVVAFGGRILKKDEKTAKYVNSPESEIYHKSNELYGIYFAKQAIAKLDRCFLVEGYTDVISMHQAGIENVVASSGTALTHGQIRMIHRFTKNVTVLYDGDAAGIKASLKGINLLLEEGLNIKVLLLPDGEDPDSFARRQSATDFANYLKAHETDFIRFKTDILLKDAGNDPIKRAGLIQDLVESIALIADDITRSVYVKECSRQLDFNEGLLQQEVNKKRYLHLQRDQQKRVATRNGLPEVNSNGYQRPSPRPEISNDVRTGGTPAFQGQQPPEDLFAPPPSEEFAPESSFDGYNQGTLPGEILGNNPGNRSDYAPGQAQTSYVQPLVQAKPAYPFAAFERNILKMIVRFGERSMGVDEDEEGHEIPVNVTQFICLDLEINNIKIEHPQYARMFDEAATHAGDPGFHPQRLFFNHRDPEISLLAADLISEPYELSKYHGKLQTLIPDEDKLDEMVPNILDNLKHAIVRDKLKSIEQKLKSETDSDAIRNLMLEHRDLKTIEKEIGKNLGERIVVR